MSLLPTYRALSSLPGLSTYLPIVKKKDKKKDKKKESKKKGDGEGRKKEKERKQRIRIGEKEVKKKG